MWRQVQFLDSVRPKRFGRDVVIMKKEEEEARTQKIDLECHGSLRAPHRQPIHTHTQASGCCVCGMEGRTARAVLLRSRPHSSPKEERRTTTFSNETDETAANRCAAYSHSEQKVLTTILIDASTYKYTIIYTHTHTLYRQRRIYLYQEKLPGRRDSQDDESNR